MTDALQEAGFCFDCADQDGEEAFVPPSPNPWPMLVLSEQLGHLRCQPLVRLVYTPRPLPQLLALLQEDELAAMPDSPEASRAFKDRVKVMHEYVHFFMLDRTPAKELARAHLAYSYDIIAQFTRVERHNDERLRQFWESFRKNSARLSQTLVKISRAEELLATAFAYAMAEADVRPGRRHERFRDAFAQVREEMLGDHENGLPGFTTDYERIEPLVALMASDASFFSKAMPLLQPILWQDDDVVAVDAAPQLLDLVDALSKVETMDQADVVLQERREPYDSAWRIALGLQQGNAANPEIVQDDLLIRYGAMADLLLSIARGDMVYERSGLQDPASDFSFDVGPTGLVFLALGQYRRRSVLERMTFFLREPDDASNLRERYRSLAHFEALRQQLCAHSGIVCPENPRGLRQCRCSPQVRQALHRLGDLAVSGYFGPGDWSRPSCRS